MEPFISSVPVCVQCPAAASVCRYYVPGIPGFDFWKVLCLVDEQNLFLGAFRFSEVLMALRWFLGFLSWVPFTGISKVVSHGLVLVFDGLELVCLVHLQPYLVRLLSSPLLLPTHYSWFVYSFTAAHRSWMPYLSLASIFSAVGVPCRVVSLFFLHSRGSHRSCFCGAGIWLSSSVCVKGFLDVFSLQCADFR